MNNITFESYDFAQRDLQKFFPFSSKKKQEEEEPTRKIFPFWSKKKQEDEVATGDNCLLKKKPEEEEPAFAKEIPSFPSLFSLVKRSCFALSPTLYTIHEDRRIARQIRQSR